MSDSKKRKSGCEYRKEKRFRSMELEKMATNMKSFLTSTNQNIPDDVEPIIHGSSQEPSLGSSVSPGATVELHRDVDAFEIMSQATTDHFDSSVATTSELSTTTADKTEISYFARIMKELSDTHRSDIIEKNWNAPYGFAFPATSQRRYNRNWEVQYPWLLIQ